MRHVLFLCTGNYYRSRFAEALFNHLAEHNQLDWRAVSAGLALERGTSNVGPLSPYAEFGLLRRGVRLPRAARMPRAVTATDFATANRAIAVDEEEHRPLLAARFPEWADQINYWHVHDLDRATSEIALAQLAQLVQTLVDDLALAEQLPAQQKSGGHRAPARRRG